MDELKDETVQLECAKCSKLLVNIKGTSNVRHDNVYCGKCDDLLVYTRAFKAGQSSEKKRIKSYLKKVIAEEHSYLPISVKSMCESILKELEDG